MVASPVDLEIEQNAKWMLDIGGYAPLAADPSQPDLEQPIPLDGWTATMQIRDEPSDPDPIITLDEESGRVTIDADGIHLRLLASETAGLSFRMAHYDLRMVPPGGDDDAEYWVRGRVRLIPAVTR